MPYSFGTFDKVVDSLIRQINPKNILDIGCGAGKYGELAKAASPNARRIGIEVAEKYVEHFKLRDIYDEVRVGDAQSVLKNSMGESYDLVIFGDSIEHMPKSVGIDLLNFLTYRSQYILILAPEFIIQHEVNGVAEEAHVSVWSEHDFTWHDRWAWDNCWMISLFLLRGYLGGESSLNGLVESLNASGIPLYAENSQAVVRQAKLTMEERGRLNINQAGQQVFFRPR